MIGMVKGTMRETKTVAGLPSAIASFRTNASGLILPTCKTSVTAVQSGSGDPYPAGGGKNKLPSISETQTINGVKFTLNSDGSITLSNTATANVVVDLGRGVAYLKAGTYTSNVAGTGYNVVIFQGNESATTLKNGGGTFTLSSDDYVFERIIISSGTTVSGTIYPQIEAGSSATSYAPYANIRPISGWSGAVLSRVGVNLWDEEWELGIINTTTGQNQASNTQIRSVNHIPVKPSTTYRLKVSSTSGVWCAIEAYKSDKSFLQNLGGVTNGSTFTTPADCYYIRFYTAPAYGTTYNNDISINYPSTDTAYHAYLGTTYTLQFGQTLYGAVIDWNTGVATVKKAFYQFDGTETPIAYGSGWRYVVLSGKEAKSYGGAEVPTDLISNTYVAISRNSISSGASGISITGDTVLLSTNSPSGIQLCYELATPTTIQLTPQQITQLANDNNVFVDCGEIEELKYQNRIVTKLFSKG